MSFVNKFGRCPRCFFITIIGLVVSSTLLPLGLISDGCTVCRLVYLPAIVFALWLAFHVAGLLIARARRQL